MKRSPNVTGKTSLLKAEGVFMRTAVVATAIGISIVAISVAAEVEASIKRPTNIPAQRLDRALQVLAVDRGLAMAYHSEIVGERPTEGASGDLTREEVLTQLLNGTGLTYRFLDEKTVTIVPAPAWPADLSAGEERAALQADETSATRAASRDQDQKAPGSFWGRFRLAQLDQGTTRDPAAVEKQSDRRAQEDKDVVVLAEVIVTAGKRTEKLSQVGGAISAFSGDQLESHGADNLADYAAFIPGLSIQSYGATGHGIISIRGISPQSVGASTATYIDETPFGPSSALSRGAQFGLDLDPTDLERVEVLKGPQGTLYGASSMGGVLKYVTRAPNLKYTEISTSEDFNAYQHGGSGVKLRGAVSMPLVEDKLALRVSGYHRDSGGFIDNDNTSIGGKDINGGTDWGFRGALLYQPTDTLSIKLNALHQDNESDGQDVVDYQATTLTPTFGDLEQTHSVRDPFTAKISLFSTEINWHVGPGTLVSATSYSKLDTNVRGDSTPSAMLNSSFLIPTPSPQAPVGAGYAAEVEKRTQELRFASDRIGPLEFIAGGYYTHEEMYEVSDTSRFLTTGELAPGDPLSLAIRSGTLEEYAGFANATWYLSDRFDVSGGYRYSTIDQYRYGLSTGILRNRTNPTAQVITDQDVAPENSSTYLAAARWRVTDDILLYARAASGYRPGGGRPIPTGAPVGFPNFFTSDSLWSYEVGTKIRGLDDRLSLEFDGFLIDWSNIQTLERVGTSNTDGNAGTARSRGLELQVDYVAAKGLTVGANAAYTDARFTQANVALRILDGDRLFFVSKWTTAAYTEYSTPISAKWSIMAGGDYQYRSDRLDQNRFVLPGYATVNLHAGLRNDVNTISFYVRNLADERGLIGSSSASLAYPSYTFLVTAPRSYGMTFTQKF
jgi:outer membrane receptor protein involved in Fe transport